MTGRQETEKRSDEMTLMHTRPLFRDEKSILLMAAAHIPRHLWALFIPSSLDAPLGMALAAILLTEMLEVFVAKIAEGEQ